MSVFELIETASGADPERAVLVLVEVNYQIVRQAVTGGIGDESVSAKTAESTPTSNPDITFAVCEQREDEAADIHSLSGAKDFDFTPKNASNALICRNPISAFTVFCHGEGIVAG